MFITYFQILPLKDNIQGQTVALSDICNVTDICALEDNQPSLVFSGGGN